VLLALAFLTGLAFLLNKVVEYQVMVGDGHEPTTNAYYTYFFIMTAIHAAHVVSALIVLIVMWRIARKPALAARDIRAIESGATWWHLIDLLWIVLFPLLYLVR
jgi:nitric oxide reductase NorE protein